VPRLCAAVAGRRAVGPADRHSAGLEYAVSLPPRSTPRAHAIDEAPYMQLVALIAHPCRHRLAVLAEPSGRRPPPAVPAERLAPRHGASTVTGTAATTHCKRSRH
jgi:hypothetical protein